MPHYSKQVVEGMGLLVLSLLQLSSVSLLPTLWACGVKFVFPDCHCGYVGLPYLPVIRAAAQVPMVPAWISSDRLMPHSPFKHWL